MRLEEGGPRFTVAPSGHVPAKAQEPKLDGVTVIFDQEAENMRLRLALAAGLVAIAFVAYAPVNSAMVPLIGGDDSALPAIHTMPIYNPLDVRGTLTGSSSAQTSNLVYGGGPLE